MRTETEVLAAIEAAQAEYQKAVDTQPAKVANALGAKVKELRAELSATLSRGAEKCPDCDNAPTGLRRYDAGGKQYYEVGCLYCKPEPVTGKPAEEIRPCTQGLQPHHAVADWNAGLRIVFNKESRRVVDTVQLGLAKS